MKNREAVRVLLEYAAEMSHDLEQSIKKPGNVDGLRIFVDALHSLLFRLRREFEIEKNLRSARQQTKARGTKQK